MKITKKMLQALARDKASHLQSEAAVHLLKGKISGLVWHVSNKLLNSVDGAGKPKGLPCTPLFLMALLSLTSHCPSVISNSDP